MNLQNDISENYLKSLPDNSVDGCVSDFPYGLKFMGKKWDYELPSVEALTELLRVLKPGAFLFGFGGSRTYHRLVCRLEDVGFEIRDCIMWIYGSGFPKGKSCLKPAYEPVVVCRKAGKVQQLNIDECRIEMKDGDRKGEFGDHSPEACNFKINDNNILGKGILRLTANNSVGRWPANIIIDEQVAELVDAQSGISGGDKRTVKLQTGTNGAFTTQKDGQTTPCYQDIGGASRFFKQIEWSENELPRFRYNAKACPSDRNYGMVDGKNTHATVKPIKLMRYLVKLINQPENPDFTIIDPYMGSGTTGVACALEGINFIGCEKETLSFEQAKQRIEFAKKEFDKSKQTLF